MLLTLDSSIFVAALRKEEERYNECKTLLDSIVNHTYQAIEPYSVLIEVIAAVRRRTGSKEFAKEIEKGLQEISSIIFLELIRYRVKEASSIAINTGLKGMDAIVVQVAKEMDSFLVSLDDDMIKKAKPIVKVKSLDELI
jgi:predicted nucleic acid-binding protein